MDENIIELNDLTKKYGSFTAVDHLNLSIRKSEIFGLLGPNGAGKSTTILMMLGLTEISGGSVDVLGFDPVRQPLEVGLFVSGKLIAEGNIQSLSQKLFSKNPFVIEVGIEEAITGVSGKYTADWLQQLLHDTAGILEVKKRNGVFEIGCSIDAASGIAAAILASGEKLTHLNKKEYGLDDIYYRYFEGGTDHE